MNNNFSKNLKFLREKQELQQKELAEDLNIDKTTVSAWERGINFPEVETLIKISDYFNVSIDSLLGLSNTRINIDNFTDEEREMLKGIRELDRDEKNKLKGYLKALLEYKVRGHR